MKLRIVVVIYDVVYPVNSDEVELQDFVAVLHYNKIVNLKRKDTTKNEPICRIVVRVINTVM